jgi:hypothetical protein
VAAFNIPVFNLKAFIYHHAGQDMNHPGVPDLEVSCNLANGRIAHVPLWLARPPSPDRLSMSSSLLLPKGTDIRDQSCEGGPDVVEVPIFSGRFYWVTYVDDIAKGFSNEHRWAVIQKIWTYGFWTAYRWRTPIP